MHTTIIVCRGFFASDFRLCPWLNFQQLRVCENGKANVERNEVERRKTSTLSRPLSLEEPRMPIGLFQLVVKLQTIGVQSSGNGCEPIRLGHAKHPCEWWWLGRFMVMMLHRRREAAETDSIYRVPTHTKHPGCCDTEFLLESHPIINTSAIEF